MPACLVVLTLAALVAQSPAARAAAPILTPLGAVADAPGDHGTTGIAASPSGEHVYLAATADDALTLKARDAGTGVLATVAVYRDGVAGVDGLAGVGDVVVSPDGAHVYATGGGEDALAAFARDAGTGALTPIGVLRDGVGGVDGLDRPVAIAVSADGAHVYVASSDDAAIAVFARDAGTGVLTFVEREQHLVGGVSGLHGAHAVAVSPDGAHVYGRGNALVGFARDAGTGALTFLGTTTLAPAGNVVLSPDGAHVYAYRASTSTDFGEVFAFARNATTGALVAIDDYLFRGMSPEGRVAITPDGAFVHASQPQDDAVMRFVRNATTGALSGATSVSIAGGVPGANDHPRGVLVPSDGAQLYTTVDLGGGVAGFTRDVGTGALQTFDADDSPIVANDGLDGVAAVAFSPDGGDAYAVGLRDASLVHFARDPATGALTWVATLREGEGGVTGMPTPAHVVVAPDGGHVYVLDATGGLVTFARDAGTGAPTFVTTAMVDDPGCAPVLSPDGTSLYLCSAVFARNPTTGALALIQEPDGLRGGPIRVSADGRFVYGSNGGAEQIYVHARDAATGLLTAVQTVGDTNHGGNLPNFILSSYETMDLSSDGRHLVTRGRYLGVLARDPLTGRLKAAGQPTLLGGGNNTGTILADGAYAIGCENEPLVARARNPLTGALVPAATVPVSSVPGGTLDVSAVAGSPDARHVYAAIGGRDRIEAFAVDQCGPLVVKPSLTATKVGSDPQPANDGLALKGSFLLRSGTFASLDLAATGARLVLEAADGTPRADVTLPPGAYTSGATRGWRLSGRSWTYRDRTGALLNGVSSVKLTDGSRSAAGLVAVTVKAKNGTWPLVAGDVPPFVGLVVGAPAQCARSVFAPDDCTAASTTVKCRIQ